MLNVTTSKLTEIFKKKIEEAIVIVQSMSAEDILKAVQYWNLLSDRFQDIVNQSTADSKDPGLRALDVPQAIMTRFITSNSSGTGVESPFDKLPTVQLKHVNEQFIIMEKYLELDEDGDGDVEIGNNEKPEETVMEIQVESSRRRNKIYGSSETSDNVPNVSSLSQKTEEDPEWAHDPSVATSNSHKLPPTAKKQCLKKRGKGQRVRKAETNTYECRLCSKTFSTQSQHLVHTWIHTKPYTCSDCDARFSTKGNLIVHKRKHTGERPFTCIFCEAQFSTKGNLKRHVRTHSGEKPWKCSDCDARFTENKSLKVHMRKHTGERPYRCTICHKSFSQMGILQTHIAVHLDKRNHLCNQCGKSFRQKSQLHLHQLRHAGVRKFQCPLCSIKFLTKGDMNRHKITHTGERPFVCELCGKNFTRQQSLNEHMNRHYSIKPYSCKHCSKAFVEMSACYKHIKSHEQDKTYTSKLDMSKINESVIVSDCQEDSDKLTVVEEVSVSVPQVQQQSEVPKRESPQLDTTTVLQHMPSENTLQQSSRSCGKPIINFVFANQHPCVQLVSKEVPQQEHGDSVNKHN